MNTNKTETDHVIYLADRFGYEPAWGGSKNHVGYDGYMLGLRQELKAATAQANGAFSSSIRFTQWHRGMVDPDFRWLFSVIYRGQQRVFMLTHAEYRAMREDADFLDEIARTIIKYYPPAVTEEMRGQNMQDGHHAHNINDLLPYEVTA